MSDQDNQNKSDDTSEAQEDVSGYGFNLTRPVVGPVGPPFAEGAGGGNLEGAGGGNLEGAGGGNLEGAGGGNLEGAGGGNLEGGSENKF